LTQTGAGSWIHCHGAAMVRARVNGGVMSSNFCPHLIFKFGDLIEFSVLKD